MANFDEIRRQAEQAFGKDVVDQIERQATKQINSTNSHERHLLSVDNADFTFKKTPDVEISESRTETGNTMNNKLPGQIATSAQPKKQQGRIVRDVDVSNVKMNSKSSTASEALIAQAIKGEYLYGMLGLILGMSSIVGGIILCLHGVGGSTSWTAKLLGLSSKINDAAPGVVLFIVGLFFVLVTKPKVSLKNLRG